MDSNMMRRMTRIVCVSALMVISRSGTLSAAGSGPVGPAASSPAQPPFVMRTYTYKEVGDLRIQADVYRRDDGQPRPVLLWLHGGALVVGNRQNIRPDLLDLCRSEDYCLVSPDHRLAPEVKLPQIIEDLRDFIRWVNEEGPGLFLADTSRIVVAGNSSGGYLTMMAGFCKPRPNALMSYWGYGSVGGPVWDSRSPNPTISKEAAEKAISKIPLTNVQWNTKLCNDRLQKLFAYLAQNGLLAKEVLGSQAALITTRASAGQSAPAQPATPRHYELALATCFGGSRGDLIRDITVDAQGNIYVAGTAGSPGFPTTPGALPGESKGGGAMVAKFSPAGGLIWSKVYRGPYGFNVKVDRAGHVYVAGKMEPGFPTTPGAFQPTTSRACGFVGKLKPDVSDWVWASYVGTGMHMRDLALDEEGNVYGFLDWFAESKEVLPSSWFTSAFCKTPHSGPMNHLLATSTSRQVAQFRMASKRLL